MSSSCLFCRISTCEIAAHRFYRDEEILAIPDLGQIRRGHALIFPHAHVETFDQLEPGVAARLLHLGQRIARVQKKLYSVDRVAFLFSGGDIPHVHAHVVPMFEKTDITSRRYIAEADLTFRPIPPTPPDELAAISAELRNGLSELE